MWLTKGLVVVFHQTTADTLREPVGLGKKPPLALALHLVKRGYVVLVPDYPSFGDYKYDFNADSYTSGSMKGP